METFEPLSITTSNHSYEILFTDLDNAISTTWPSLIDKDNKIIIFADNNTLNYANKVKQLCDKLGYVAEIFVLPYQGEDNKTLMVISTMLEKALSLGITRRSTFIAVGGGVVGDVTGFMASIALRGVNYIQIPTTLLAQVDSSVGGKTGVNCKGGKNLIGSFYQPSQVIIDSKILSSLPKRQIRAGYAEILKYALINDLNFFNFLQQYAPQILNLEEPYLIEAIYKSCQHKAHIVNEDEKEQGQRALLNLGHTFGHALETVCNYSDTILHGEAVAIGCLLAFLTSYKMQLCPKSDVEEVKKHLLSCGFELDPNKLIPDISSEQLIAAMLRDKKNTTMGEITCILAQGIGKSFIAKNTNVKLLQQVWNEYKNT
jgi:3-dehydroquinate synthase